MSKVQRLRQLLGQENILHLHESLSCRGLERGIPKGKISEISGAGKTELVARFLAEHRDKPAVWVDRSLDIYPAALHQRKVNLEQLLFVEARHHLKWSLQQLLASGLFEILVAPNMFRDLRDLRQLQLSCERSQCCLLLLSDVSRPAWPISVRIQVDGGKVLQQRYKQVSL